MTADMVQADRVPDDVRRLGAHILRAGMATAALESWCRARFASSERVAVRHRAPSRMERPGDSGLDALMAGGGEPIEHRSICLVWDAVPLCRADNWIMPQRLPAETVRRLRETATPFGAVVAPLGPTRRTIAVRYPGAGSAGSPAGSDPATVLEIEAVVLVAARPVAFVKERYLATLLGGGV